MGINGKEASNIKRLSHQSLLTDVTTHYITITLPGYTHNSSITKRPINLLL